MLLKKVFFHPARGRNAATGKKEEEAGLRLAIPGWELPGWQ